MSAPICWIDTGNYRVPAKSTDGMYEVWLQAGGKRGPVFQAQLVVGVGIFSRVGGPRSTIPEAKADAQAHANEIARVNAAAARNPMVRA